MNTVKKAVNQSPPAAPLSLEQKQYLQKHRRHHHLITCLRLMLFLAFLVIWEFSGRLGYIDTFFFSSPSLVIHCFLTMLKDGSFFLHTGITLGETLLSFFWSRCFPSSLPHCSGIPKACLKFWSPIWLY